MFQKQLFSATQIVTGSDGTVTAMLVPATEQGNEDEMLVLPAKICLCSTLVTSGSLWSCFS